MQKQDADNFTQSKTGTAGSRIVRKGLRSKSRQREQQEAAQAPNPSMSDRGEGSATGDHEIVFEPDRDLVAAAEAELGPAPDLRRGHFVIDPEALRSEVGDTFDPEESDAAASSEEAARLGRLRRLALDPDGLYKRHAVADAALISRLEALRETTPNADAVLDVLIGAARISMRTGAGIQTPPFLIVGPAGCGKSRLVREVGKAFGTSSLTLIGSTMPDASAILGTAVGWRGASPGRLTELLLRAPTSSPCVFIDEIEKIRLWDRRDHAADLFLGLLDSETAETFEDAYDRVPMRAERTRWFFAANSLTALSEPFLDRCLVFEMQPPSRAERREVVRRIHDDVRKRLGLDPSATLSDHEVDRLDEISLRRVGTVARLAFGRALTAGRDRLSTDDLAWALAAVERGRAAEIRRIGF